MTLFYDGLEWQKMRRKTRHQIRYPETFVTQVSQILRTNSPHMIITGDITNGTSSHWEMCPFKQPWQGINPQDNILLPKQPSYQSLRSLDLLLLFIAFFSISDKESVRIKNFMWWPVKERFDLAFQKAEIIRTDPEWWMLSIRACLWGCEKYLYVEWI